MANRRKGGVSFDDLSTKSAARYLSDIEVTFEYTDIDGRQSRRAVRILHCDQGILTCFCYLRNDVRSFRIDRIGGVIDRDGEVLSARQFLALFNLNAGQPAQPDARAVNAAAQRGFGALAASEAQLAAELPRRKPRITKTKAALMVVALLVLVALVA